MVGEDRVGKERGKVEKERVRGRDSGGERAAGWAVFAHSLFPPLYRTLEPGSTKRLLK